MIIAIDGYEANVGHRVGIGRYAYEILTGLRSLTERNENRDIQFRIYLPGEPRGDMPVQSDNWKYFVRTPKKLWTFLGLPLALLRDTPPADVIFSPTHYVPRFTGIPRVMSVMDLSYLYFPELFKNKDRYQLTRWTKFAVAHAAAVCTISEFSKNDIIRKYGIPGGRVHVTYPGFSIDMKKDLLPMAALSAKYQISKHYILSVGTVQPRKNYERLIEAFSLFLAKNKQKFGEIDLVIVGKKGWLVDAILAAPAEYGVADRVKFLDFVPDAELPELYRNALCFALPSLYEGFGLPVLEAMAYKTPVVISNVSSLPEIAGKAGIYVDPERPESIAEGLLTAVRQRNLLQGKTRIQAGLGQVRLFSWDRAAEQTLEILKAAGRSKS